MPLDHLKFLRYGAYFRFFPASPRSTFIFPSFFFHFLPILILFSSPGRPTFQPSPLHPTAPLSKWWSEFVAIDSRSLLTWMCINLHIHIYIYIYIYIYNIYIYNKKYIYISGIDNSTHWFAKQIVQSKDESQQIAVWRLLYWLQHLDQ